MKATVNFNKCLWEALLLSVTAAQTSDGKKKYIHLKVFLLAL